ncbi:kinase-like protein, partial [Polychaeton citri CBS 116435]
DQYREVRKLTQSSQGECSLLKSKTTGNVYVLKRSTSLPLDIDANGWPREARMLVHELKPHPNIIYCFDAKFGRGYRCDLYLEYCSGGDLHDQLTFWMTRRQIPPTEVVLHVFVQLSRALAYIHHGLRYDGHLWLADTDHKPIIHGDLKPENVFLRWSKRNHLGLPDVVLGDFGLSKTAAESRGGYGTEGWEPPEMVALRDLYHTDPEAHSKASKEKVMSTASDMYSLGMIMYFMASQYYQRWSTGRAGEDMQLAAVFVANGLGSIISRLLQSQSVDRASANFDARTGYLHALKDLAKERD